MRHTSVVALFVVFLTVYLLNWGGLLPLRAQDNGFRRDLLITAPNAAEDTTVYLWRHFSIGSSAYANTYQMQVPIGGNRYACFDFKDMLNNGVINFCRIREGIAVSNLRHNAIGVQKVGSWGLTSPPNNLAYGGSLARSTTAGDTISATVTGHTLLLRTARAPDGGYGLVAIDGDFTKANRLPVVTQALIDAGKFAPHDLGKRYLDFYSFSYRYDEHIPLAEKLSDAPHIIAIKVTNTARSENTQSEKRVYVAAFAAASAATRLTDPGASMGYIREIHNLFDNFSATTNVIKFAPESTPGQPQYLGDSHGIDSPQNELPLSEAVFSIDDVPVSLEPGAFVSGSEIRLERATVLNHPNQANVADKRVVYTARADRPMQLQADVTLTFHQPGTLHEAYWGMLPVGIKSTLVNSFIQPEFDRALVGQDSLITDADMDDSDDHYSGQQPTDFIAFFSTRHDAVAVAYLPDLAGAVNNFARGGPFYTFIRDAVTGIDKGYFCRASLPQPEIVTAGTVLSAPICWRVLHLPDAAKVLEQSPLEAAMLEAQDTSAAVGQTITLRAQLKRASNGAPLYNREVQFKVCDTPVGSAETGPDGVAVLDYTVPDGLDAANPITVEFDGDNLYHPASASATLTIAPQATNLSLQNRTAKVGQTITLTAFLQTLAGNTLAGQTLTFLIDGIEIGTALTDSAGVASLSYKVEETLGTGVKPLTVSYAGVTAYEPSCAVGTLTITAANTYISVVPLTGRVAQTVTLQARPRRSTDQAALVGKPVAFSIDGTPVGTALTEADGMARLPYVVPEFGAGPHAIRAEFAGDTVYTGASNTNTLTVLATHTYVGVWPVSGRIAQTVTLQARLRRSGDSLPLAGKTLRFLIEGNEVGTAATDSAGLARLPLPLAESIGAGTHAIRVEFAGDSNYNLSSATNTLTVLAANTYVGVWPVTARIGQNVTLRARLRRSGDNLALAGKTLVFKVDDIEIGSAATGEDGMATLPLFLTTDLTVGTKTIRVEFGGDSHHNPCSGTAALTVTPWPTYIGAWNVAGRPGQTVTLRARPRRTGDNLALVGVTVRFQIDGAEVGTAVTDSEGIASLACAIPAEAVPGNQTITAELIADATYAGASCIATLTVY
jgi:hypothetical protein